MKIFTGFEPTRIITKQNGLTDMADVLENSEHLYRYSGDLRLVQECGINLLRTAVPWYRIEKEPGVYDWTWMDGYMERMKAYEIEPILDPLHHVSIPTWLKGGWLDTQFVDRYVTFFEKIVTRYPWVSKYTIVNEPLVTTWFCTHEGIWYPFAKARASFEEGLDNIFQIIKRGAVILKEQGKEHWYIDASEEHRGTCSLSHPFAEERNAHRFMLLDRLVEANVQIDVLGLDYYPHCEFDWCVDGRARTDKPVGFAEIAKKYWERYHLPLALTETNIRGYVTDRQTWFVHMYKECQRVEEFAPFKGMCWYPFIDSTDWDTLVTENNGNIDPQGIVWLDENLRRQKSEFFENVKKLQKGEIKIDDVPTYSYLPPLEYLDAWNKVLEIAS